MIGCKSNYIVGFDYVKCLMCVVVVFIHFGPAQESPYFFLGEFQKLYPLAVPVFMLISFFLLSSKLDNLSQLIKKRTVRLLYPQIAWALILYLFYSTLNVVEITDKHLTIKLLIAQMVLGHSYNPPMWFIADCLILSVTFLFLYRFFNNRFPLICITFILLSFLAQHFDVHYKLFGALPYEIRYPLGRLLEMIPYAFGGYLLHKFLGNRHMSIIHCCALFCITLLLIFSSAQK